MKQKLENKIKNLKIEKIKYNEDKIYKELIIEGKYKELYFKKQFNNINYNFDINNFYSIKTLLKKYLVSLPNLKIKEEYILYKDILYDNNKLKKETNKQFLKVKDIKKIYQENIKNSKTLEIKNIWQERLNELLNTNHIEEILLYDFMEEGENYYKLSSLKNLEELLKNLKYMSLNKYIKQEKDKLYKNNNLSFIQKQDLEIDLYDYFYK